MRRRSLAALALLALVGAGALLWFSQPWPEQERETGVIALLLPDNAQASDPRVQLWLDAAREEGVRMQPVSASAFLRRARGERRFAGLVLPDTIHKAASPLLADALTDYVSRGGRLMLVFDAATLDVGGTWTRGSSRLSRLAGVEYALYEQLGDATIERTPVVGDPEALGLLTIPPGKFNPAGALSSYQYDVLTYPRFVTRGEYRGRRLLATPDGGLVAGHHGYEQGQVLFVNLPLGYLKLQTDGLLLHGFLRFFAVCLLQLPHLAPVPEGVGGLVMNWHVDSNASLPAMKALERLGMFEQGPYSIHLTAGPDTYAFGDGLGLNVAHNPEIQQWMRYFVSRGDAVGSHGGWIHNYFGRNVNETNQAEFEQYLSMNNRDVSAVTGRPVTEYSAPDGNQPKWVTAWLEKNGIHAYYFTGNIGMGPTRSYRDGVRSDRNTWSFPVLSYGKVASFEEARDTGIPEDEIVRWLTELADFAARHRVLRLIYFHPPGVMLYPEATRRWLVHAGKLRAENRFRWYTMTAVADFLNRREQTEWRLEEDGRGGLALTANNPVSLDAQAWVFPKPRFGRLEVTAGAAEIEEDADAWRVVARS